MVVFGQKLLCSGKSGFIRVKMIVFGQNLLYSGKGGCNRVSWLHSGKSRCIRAKR